MVRDSLPILIVFYPTVLFILFMPMVFLAVLFLSVVFIFKVSRMVIFIGVLSMMMGVLWARVCIVKSVQVFDMICLIRVVHLCCFFSNFAIFDLHFGLFFCRLLNFYRKLSGFNHVHKINDKVSILDLRTNLMLSHEHLKNRSHVVFNV